VAKTLLKYKPIGFYPKFISNISIAEAMSKTILILTISAILALMLLAGCSKEGDTNVVNNKEIAVIETNMGTIEVELDRAHAPVTVENFISYANAGHYNGTIFHRVIRGFMIQGGGFTPNGAQKTTKAPIKLESNNGLKNTAGTIAMARTNVPDSATSQFFINTIDNDFLNYAPGNPGYAVFGKVISGMDVVAKIEGVRTTTKMGMGDWPSQDVIITGVHIKK
jgi:cyclophilin family peptidyl-prolyl cis-trans isomerase